MIKNEKFFLNEFCHIKETTVLEYKYEKKKKTFQWKKTHKMIHEKIIIKGDEKVLSCKLPIYFNQKAKIYFNI